MTDHIASLISEAQAALKTIADEKALEGWRVEFLGRNGRLTQVLRSIGSLPAEERRALGAAANQAKNALEAALATREEELRQLTSGRDEQHHRRDATRPSLLCWTLSSHHTDGAGGLRRLYLYGLHRGGRAGGGMGLLQL